MKLPHAGIGPEAPVPMNAPSGNWLVDGLPPPPQQECFESSCECEVNRMTVRMVITVITLPDVGPFGCIGWCSCGSVEA